MSSRIPLLLEPYIQIFPPDSLILLTSTVGNSSNWLVTRYLCAALSKSKQHMHAAEEIANESKDQGRADKVVLVSWLRDFEFWKTECRRAGGLDLVQLFQQRRFAFVDGLKHLFSTTHSGLEHPKSSLPIREVPPSTTPSCRRPPSQPGTQERQFDTHTNESAKPSPPTATPPFQALTSTDISATTDAISAALSALRSDDSSVLLILDNPDLLVAAASSPSSQLSAFQSLLINLRRHPAVHSTIVALSSSIALQLREDQVGPASQTELDAAQNAFATSLAHQGNLLIQLRPLDTGAASDVSGVLRVTNCSNAEDEDEQGHRRENEVLYHVKADGSLKIWERGEGIG